jgi:hypothetical protein
MSLQVSTKFKELILGPHAFADIFAYGKIQVYSGLPPVSADYPVQGTLLAEITDNGEGDGLTFTQYGAYVSKNIAQPWRMAVIANGVAGWFRLIAAGGDPGHLSYSAPRVDGRIGTTGAFDMTLESTTLVSGQSIAVQQFLYTIPPLL